MLIILGIGAGYVWIYVMDTSAKVSSPIRCAPPGGAEEFPATIGQQLAPDALDRAAPAAPNEAKVQVLNASIRRGQASIVTESLRQFGFGDVAPAKNDQVYAGLDMTCRAQIRFGAKGTAAARTLSLLEPCAELVRDNRQDATVDLAIGRKFDEFDPKPEARRLLAQLVDWSARNPRKSGGLQSDGIPQPELDGELLRSARDLSSC
jgi:hypothetical protein